MSDDGSDDSKDDKRDQHLTAERVDADVRAGVAAVLDDHARECVRVALEPFAYVDIQNQAGFRNLATGEVVPYAEWWARVWPIEQAFPPEIVKVLGVHRANAQKAHAFDVWNPIVGRLVGLLFGAGAVVDAAQVIERLNALEGVFERARELHAAMKAGATAWLGGDPTPEQEAAHVRAAKARGSN